MIQVRGYAARDAHSPLTSFNFTRRDPGPHDVQIEILYTGICHSDLHQARDHWGNAFYPMVPGHEIVGRVVAAGAHVKKLKAGDFAGVGCMVDSCRQCSACDNDLEQYCEHGPTYTYAAIINQRQRRCIGSGCRLVLSDAVVAQQLI
jgi:alcohol dehydrogenase (NADP+)